MLGRFLADYGWNTEKEFPYGDNKVLKTNRPDDKCRSQMHGYGETGWRCVFCYYSRWRSDLNGHGDKGRQKCVAVRCRAKQFLIAKALSFDWWNNQRRRVPATNTVRNLNNIAPQIGRRGSNPSVAANRLSSSNKWVLLSRILVSRNRIFSYLYAKISWNKMHTKCKSQDGWPSTCLAHAWDNPSPPNAFLICPRQLNKVSMFRGPEE